MHEFPSTCEWLDSKKMRNAKRGLKQVLGTLNSPATKAKLRDPHLLMYTSSFLDDMSMKALGEAIMTKAMIEFLAMLLFCLT